jgi:hypothetical protein
MSDSVEVTARPENAAQLADLIESLTVFDYADGGEGYEKAAEAMWRAALAAFDYTARRVGATGFQASWSALRFYGEAMAVDGPFTVVQVRDALYPQYDLPGRLQQFLDEQRPWLAEQARLKLAEDQQRQHETYTDSDGVEQPVLTASPAVVAHWRALAEAGVGDDRP